MLRELKVLGFVVVGLAVLARFAPSGRVDATPRAETAPQPMCALGVAQGPRLLVQAWDGDERLFILPLTPDTAVLEFYDGQRGFRKRVPAAWATTVIQRLAAMGAGPGFTRFTSDRALISVAPLGRSEQPSRTLSADRRAILFRYLHTEARAACAEGAPAVEWVTNDQIGADVYGFMASYGGR